MDLTRRLFLCASAGVLGAQILPRRAWAQNSVELGGMRIDTLSDGHLVLPYDFSLGLAPKDQLQAVMARYGISDQQTLEPACNVTLLRDGERTILFDVGAGPDFMPSAGKLDEAFEALGLGHDEITHVVFTHAHPDHLWGLLDEFEPRALDLRRHRFR